MAQADAASLSIYVLATPKGRKVYESQAFEVAHTVVHNEKIHEDHGDNVTFFYTRHPKQQAEMSNQ
jgi:hypothetical protein